jgi:hypothetical protein
MAMLIVNKYVLTQKLEHFGYVMFMELFVRIRVVLHNKMCPSIKQGICIYTGHSCFTQILVNYFISIVALSGE